MFLYAREQMGSAVGLLHRAVNQKLLLRNEYLAASVQIPSAASRAPSWLPASIAEAHKLGLHVHGHIPAGIRPMDAINYGNDEITHINWVMMQAMPDSVIPVSNGIMRFEGPGRYAKDVDLEGAAIEAIVGTMARKRI